ncbi:hypothetical protein BD309DRAFT_181860 [Dichomitus squalens]|nr:hypothetical protein BD309DRAFT_181860 [Dichomitus squalens]
MQSLQAPTDAYSVLVLGAVMKMHHQRPRPSGICSAVTAVYHCASSSWSLCQALPHPEQVQLVNPVELRHGSSGGLAECYGNENGVAVQIVGFFQQYLGIFKELQGKNLYLTGEGHAGMYVLYIANIVYERRSRTLRSTASEFLTLSLVGMLSRSRSVQWISHTSMNVSSQSTRPF